MQSSQFPSLFQAKSLEVINNLIEVSGSGFFLVQPDMQHSCAYLSNTPTEIEKAYTSFYFTLDPLNPSNFKDSDVRIVTLDSQIPQHELLASRYYQEFMQPYRHRYVADIFLRNARQEIIAVISLLREKHLEDFSARDIELLEAIHGFLEYTLNMVYLPKRENERSALQQHYGLTDRELDVVELLISGASNKEIARRINMGIATLKTHLHHIYRKASVQSRTELTAQIMAEL
ncbi:helix-turn-helix transcriptional regulator [Alteromonas gilva]|uniref:LuxR C-terminal-related transcriptional regulator n=1 Tax=Alteromonas gilva TaxID=2987522 RepID=A0ABT5KZS0_9ALTE|nr:LuxR C-terminal-related transcriptional regulator [Alteromonas gilva]MDC8830266.1 LuxR C-terminal-related transcriptional regulator [Alteromonas gilva]